MKIWIGCLLIALSGCATQHSHTDEAADFSRLSDEFIASYSIQHPLESVALGWHQFDGLFPRLDRAALAGETHRLDQLYSAIDRISDSALNPDQRSDRQLLLASLRTELWKYKAQQAPYRNPMFYAGAIDVSIYLKRDFAPLADRVRFITRVLRHSPEVFNAARQNLRSTLAKPFVETAIEVAEGTASFIEKDIAAEAAKVTDSIVREEFTAVSRLAIAEHRGFARWLQQERLPTATASYSLGRSGFQEMLRGERIDLSPEQVLSVGMREMAAEQARMRVAAQVIDPSKTPAEVYGLISLEHPTAKELIPTVRNTLEKAREFVVQHHLLTMPSEIRARVEETLPPFRSTSTASMDTPGPFESHATEAYYYVTPVESDWTPKQAEEWLRSFNLYTLEVINIHEAYPGHYLQFGVLNKTPLSKPAKILSSYAFAEGWAHYCEQMLLEEGYGGANVPSQSTQEDRLRAAKYQVAQSSEALLRICRLCVSVRMHCQGMTVDQATRFIMENCYYEEKAAHPEAMRGSFDPGYCFYTLGKLQLLKLRRDWRAQEGAAFSLQRFHDELLRHGAPQIRTLRELMLKDPRTWPEILSFEKNI